MHARRGSAALFYDEARFERQQAMPSRIPKTLLGQGGVQGLDGEAHRQRKALFMSLMTPERLDQLLALTRQEWSKRLNGWAASRRLVLYDEMRELLTLSVCRWAGVPLDTGHLQHTTRELAALYEHAGAVGPAHWFARMARQRSEKWLQGVLEQIRAGQVQAPEASAAHRIATHRDAQGTLLSPKVAAVELLNVLRPTVAVIVSPDEFDSWKETLELRAEAEFMAEIRRGLEGIKKKRKLYTLEELSPE